jgi:hypothetical protein
VRSLRCFMNDMMAMGDGISGSCRVRGRPSAR